MTTHGLLVFDHIPKTAGTTFRRSYLTAALPASERWILSGDETNARDRERFLSLPSSQRDRIRVVAGHDAESMRSRLPGARFVTVVRDPVQRAISSYLHARFHEGGEKLWPDVREREMSLEQFAQRYIPANEQSRIVLGDDYERLDAGQMRQRLKDRYALVGYTEAFDEFVYLLHEMEGLPLAAYGNRLVRAERESYVPGAADLESVQRSQAVDARLHQIVKEDFQSRIDALSAGSRDRLQQFLASLRAFRGDSRSDNVVPRGRGAP